MANRNSYTKPISELSGYRTFVSPPSTQRGEPKSPVLPLRQDDDEESHDQNMGPTYKNMPGPVPGRKLYRTFGKPGEEYGSPWKNFPERRTITSSSDLGEGVMDKKELVKVILAEMEAMSPEEMYGEALHLKEEQGEDWEPEEEELLEQLRAVV